MNNLARIIWMFWNKIILLTLFILARVVINIPGGQQSSLGFLSTRRDMAKSQDSECSLRVNFWKSFLCEWNFCATIFWCPNSSLDWMALVKGQQESKFIESFFTKRGVGVEYRSRCYYSTPLKGKVIVWNCFMWVKRLHRKLSHESKKEHIIFKGLMPH